MDYALIFAGKHAHERLARVRSDPGEPQAERCLLAMQSGPRNSRSVGNRSQFNTAANATARKSNKLGLNESTAEKEFRTQSHKRFFQHQLKLR